jgi:hypothetical protein
MKVSRSLPCRFETDAAPSLGSDLDDEIFGPTTRLRHIPAGFKFSRFSRSLQGHLTATIYGKENDLW